ncbi:transglycosylase SLT domain-containing protein [Microbacterium sp. VKM Ac-2870]|uniref:RHS repeat-associated core domain-containing protein n=1 Tax=Microbacterium sp. VKM Ac-2870 TaxID=2783825 RepID=UPI00188D79B8|nr:RHS repeat-associated core domain-containing protein [Microbacterium sp. VKM Ac-2870]MBF4563291.1 transglycosylase SLT domain-containing protein [Microbacterium sp. VKM Ac-2870]
MPIRFPVSAVIALSLALSGLGVPPLAAAQAAPRPEADGSASPTGTSVAVDGQGAADGYHLRVTSASTGFVWQDIAVLRPADMSPGSWYGYQCVTADGNFAAVAVLPGTAINLNTARDHGAYAYGVDLRSGSVTALGSGVGLKYHSPQCGLDDSAVFTSNPGSNEATTVATRYDLSSGKQTVQSVVAGQVTSVIPAGDGMVGAEGTSLVTLPGEGSLDAPAKSSALSSAGGAAFDLRPAADGGIDLLSAGNDGHVQLLHEKGGQATKDGGDSAAGAKLFLGANGHNIAIGVPDATGVTSVDASKLPAGADNVTLDGAAAFGPRPGAPPTKPDNATTQADLSQQVSPPLVQVSGASDAKDTTVQTDPTSGDSSTGPALPGAGGPSDASTQPAPKEVKRSAFVQVGPSTVSVATASYIHPAVSSGASTPTCSIPRLQPTLQAMQPSNAQVDWATQMAEQGLLSGSAYARPANFASMGLVSYSPSDDFSPIALEHPSSDNWATVPRSVMVAIEAQESNFNQASWHALPGLAGDPLIADYYGAGDSIDTIDYPDADCGYGVAQVTTGMHADDTSISHHGQMKVAVDYEENIAAGLNILQSTWNQLYDAGITANGGDPRYLENWYFAAWAYNTGVQPTAAFGNTSGCTPSPTCAGPDGTWGLGWSNNPRNPDYDPSRAPYLKNTYGDAAHPSSWPYQERIMGWMGSPLIRYGYIAYDTPDYHGGNSWLQIPGVNSMCSGDNHCDPSNAAGGYCNLSDSECWWHQPVTWVSNCSSTCATAAYEDGAGSTEPSYTDPYPPTCNQDTSKVPSGSIIVDDLADPTQNRQGCAGMNWSNGGSFSYSPGTNSSGDPVGNIDTHQLGSGFGGHILFTHTEPASSTSLINTGTWTPNLPSLQYYKVKIHIPQSGATATDVVYTINPGGSASPWKMRVNQDWESEQWVTIGTFAMQNGGNVQLSNASSMAAGEYDVAFDAIAFVPQGGTPGQPIGGPPGIQDAPKGSNPAWVNCGCVRRTEGDPVDTATGYFGESLTDLNTPGLGEALTFTRTYSSSLADPSGPSGASALNGPLGRGWSFNYGMSATTGSGGSVTVHQEDGSTVPFTVDSSGHYTPSAPRFDATLVKSGSTYVFTRHSTDQFTFDVTTGRLQQISDPAGRAASTPYATTLAYDSSGHLHTVTDPAGRAYTFTWTGSHITKVVSPAAQEVDYVYNTAGDLTDVYGVGTTRTGGTNGDQDHTQYQYTSANLMSSQRSPANYGKTASPTPVTSMTYDTSERVLTQTDPVGDVTTFTYGPNSSAGLSAGQTLVTDPVGHKTLYTYQNGLLTSMTKGYGQTGASTWSYAYDPVTLGVSVQTNPDGSTQTFSYDDAGHQISSSDGLGRTTATQYDAAGNVIQRADPTGLQTITTYNAAAKPTKVLVTLLGQSADSANDVLNPSYARSTSYAYSDPAHPGNVTGYTDPNAYTTTYTYDAFGDMTSTTDAQGNVTKYGYDTNRGWKTSTVAPVGVAAGVAPGCTPPAKGCTTFSYDPYGHVTTTTNALGHTSKATFDADGNQLTTTDGNNHTTTTTFDAADRPVKVQQPSSDVTQTAYNADSTVHTVTDAASHTTTYAYDAQARVVTMTDKDGKNTTYTYDGLGRLKTTTKPNGDSATQSWDNAGQLSGITYSGTSTPATSYTYDAAGRRTAMADGTGTNTYSYDAFGEPVSVKTGAGAVTKYSYDAAGNTTTIVYPGASTGVTRHFNTLEQLDRVTDPAGAVTSFAYSPDGMPTTTSYGNGDTATVAYDNADQPTSSALSRGATALGTITYGRDNTGDLNATTPSAGAPGSATSYGYNANQYLASSTVGSTATSYAYDNVGNPTKLGAATQTFDPAGRLCWSTTSAVSSPSCTTAPASATTYSYDTNGDRTRKAPFGTAATTYSYNAAGELTSLTGATAATYTYNGDGLRATKTASGSTATFTWDARGKVPELLSDGTTNYVYGPTGTPFEQFASGGSSPTYYFADAHGSTTELMNQAGTVTGSYSYSAWGSVSTHSGTATPIQFAGAYADTETGFLYLQARYYDPATALFVSVDPLVRATLAAYLYASNDPLNRTDPLGLWSWDDTWDLAGMIGLAIVGVALTISLVGAEGDVGVVAGEAALGTELGASLAAEEAGAEYAESAAQGARLSEDLAIQEGMSGEGRSIAGAGAEDGRGIDDVDRLTSEYGGEPGDWAKMTARTTHRFPDGRVGQAHWYENIQTGCKVEGKLKY